MTEQNQAANQEVTSEEFVTETAQPEKTSREEQFFGHTTTIGTTPEERAINTSKKSTEESDDLEIEIIDDRPIADRKTPRVKTTATDDEDIESEIEGVDEQVKKRINRLKYEFHEERRAKEATEKVREEAITYAQKVQEENKRLAALIGKGEEALLGQISAKAQSQLERAKAEFKEAYESGNSEKMLEANETILNSSVDLRSANEKINYYEQQKQVQAQQPVAPQQTASQQFAPPDPKGVKWLQDNKWFGDPKHKDLTGFAYGLHETLINDERIHPTSDEYYQQVDTRMRKAFPDFFGTENQAEDTISTDVVETASSRKPSSVVAPATRNNGAMPRKVQLTATQVNLARRLGITPEQYAKQLAKESRNV
tara:strand:+ start:4101 stop:5207 length:1107 start_codon:yes stop_codon:yes gene_type:complete